MALSSTAFPGLRPLRGAVRIDTRWSLYKALWARLADRNANIFLGLAILIPFPEEPGMPSA